MINVPQSALVFGFSNDSIGAHSSRTIMLTELSLLLAACERPAGLDAFRAAIVDDNALLKKTDSTRRESFRRLRELYALNEDVLLFRALRDLWNDDSQAQPLLALLCAMARDPVLRGTAEMMLALPVGSPVTPQMISQAVNTSFPDRFNAMTLANMGRHAASSWQQSGHLKGRLQKMRIQAQSRPAAAAYALLLGYLCGERGEGLFHTLWCCLLDSPVHILYEQAFAASQRGWIEYRRAGDVTDVGFRYLLRQKGQNGLQ